MVQRQKIALIAAFLLLALSAVIVAATPEGASSIVILSSERRTTSNATSITAEAGNITRLNVTSNRQTAAWQGFAGNVTGAIVLDDASGDRFYAWTLFNISGEIYTSRNGTINFNNIFPNNNCSFDQTLTGTGADAFNRTYIANFNTNPFSVGTILINASTACATRPYVNSTNQTSTTLFENILLSPEINNASNFSSGGNQSLYASILQVAGTSGFDTLHYNFQLLVPVNRTTGFNTYFFYVELD